MSPARQCEQSHTCPSAFFPWSLGGISGSWLISEKNVLVTSASAAVWAVSGRCIPGAPQGTVLHPGHLPPQCLEPLPPTSHSLGHCPKIMFMLDSSLHVRPLRTDSIESRVETQRCC